MGAKKMKDRCWFATDEGKCANPEENTQGAACSRCEAFVKAIPDAERCGDCGHRDPAGDYCYHVSSPRKADDPACRGFKPKGVGVKGKTAAAVAARAPCLARGQAQPRRRDHGGRLDRRRPDPGMGDDGLILATKNTKRELERGSKGK